MIDEKPCCRSCGFIGVEERKSKELDEITESMRLSGYKSNAKYPKAPECYWKVYDLEAEANQIIREIDQKLSDSRDPRALKRILDAPRGKCADEWIQYKPGRSPKQHDEIKMHDAIIQVQKRLIEIQDRTLEWRNEQADKDASLTKQIAALKQVHHNENRRDSSQDSSLTLAAIWVGIAISAIIGVIGLVVSIVK